MKNLYLILFTSLCKLSAAVVKTFWPFIFIICIWQLIIIILGLPSFILPSFLEVVKSLIANYKILLFNSYYTVIESVTGLTLSIVTAVIIGITIDYFKIIEKILMPVILLWQIIPLIAIAPLIVIWAGFGLASKILVVFLSGLFPCVVALTAGLKRVNPCLVELLQSMGANKYQIFKKVKLPEGATSLFAGIKIAAIYSVSGAVVAEFLGSNYGLGIYIERVMAAFDTRGLFAAVFCIIIITLILYKVVLIAEQKLLPWKFIKRVKD